MQAHPSLFPSGELIDHEEPDFLLKTDLETIGIEVTQTFQPKRGKFEPQSYDGVIKKVVCLAKKRYCEMGGAPVCVHVYPTTFEGRGINKNRMTESLARFVKRQYRVGQTVDFGNRGITTNSIEQCRTVTCDKHCIDRCAEMPEGFDQGVLFPLPEGSSVGKWWAGSGSPDVPQLSYERIEEDIRGKNERLPYYLASANRVWLLIALDLFFPTAFSEVPRSAGTWKFSFDFDKVLLFSHEDGVVEFGRCP